jgi:hypothetical protein
MAHLPRVRSALAALALCCALGVRAQAPTPGASMSLVFSNELGEGTFRTALARSLAEQLACSRAAGTSDAGAEWVAVLTVRSLSERAGTSGPATVEAVVAVSLMDTETGRVRLSRVVRSTYPLAGMGAIENLGELAGRRVARALCEVACGMPLRPMPAPPRRIIKESDW